MSENAASCCLLTWKTRLPGSQRAIDMARWREAFPFCCRYVVGGKRKRTEKDLQDLERLVLGRREQRLVLHLVGQFLLVVVWWWPDDASFSGREWCVQAGAVSFQPQMAAGRYPVGSVIF